MFYTLRENDKNKKNETIVLNSITSKRIYSCIFVTIKIIKL